MISVLQEKFGLIHPIIQAPMAGSTPPAFTAASCEAGILGSLGAGYLNADATALAVREIKKLTSRPFNVNLFAPEQPDTDKTVIKQASSALSPYRDELGLPDELPAFSGSDFEEQVQVLAELKVPVVSFTFGLPAEKQVKILKGAGIFLIGTATKPEEVRLAEAAGMDAVVLQGKEAGGHRGAFHGNDEFLALGGLLSQTRSGLPLIASGGIHDAVSIREALQAGASAVQIGTALLVAEESGAHPLHKEAIRNSNKGDTVITDKFSGKNARGLKNRFIEEMQHAPAAPYPLQNDLTKPIRAEAARQENSGLMSLWCGENGWEASSGTVAEIVRRLTTDL